MFYSIVVIYNKNYRDSKSLECLISSRLFAEKKMEVVLVDNSTSDYQNQKITDDQPGITYLSMDGNKGLSKAYNRALDYISQKTDISGQMIMVFDDDTTIPQTYFEEAENILSLDADIFVPVVWAGDSIMSPCEIRKKIPYPVKDAGDVSGKVLTAINTAMMVRGSVYSDYRYDENIFLDFIDHDFVRSQRQKNRKIHVMKTEIKQDFSRETDDCQVALKRFSIFKKDLKVYYKKEKCGMPVYHLLIFARKLRMFTKYKKFSIWFS